MIGTLNGEMTPTTPTGIRRAIDSRGCSLGEQLAVRAAGQRGGLVALLLGDVQGEAGHAGGSRRPRGCSTTRSRRRARPTAAAALRSTAARAGCGVRGPVALRLGGDSRPPVATSCGVGHADRAERRRRSPARPRRVVAAGRGRPSCRRRRSGPSTCAWSRNMAASLRSSRGRPTVGREARECINLAFEIFERAHSQVRCARLSGAVAQPGRDLRGGAPQRPLQPAHDRLDRGVPDGQVDGDVDRRRPPGRTGRAPARRPSAGPAPAPRR